MKAVQQLLLLILVIGTCISVARAQASADLVSSESTFVVIKRPNQKPEVTSAATEVPSATEWTEWWTAEPTASAKISAVVAVKWTAASAKAEKEAAQSSQETEEAEPNASEP
ncbi:hypothetical protein FJT64_003954 [Amphibalanus amphitrite]|uniref:Uncharacterized protein n=1 Tax=Amphibalanus amphitrite TaxID=1232801 RepID=A0A6A4W4K9_AMPAM|nr:hypothetical protein FJT64_003954 [Amphibalanus amphitrite]